MSLRLLLAGLLLSLVAPLAAPSVAAQEPAEEDSGVALAAARAVERDLVEALQRVHAASVTVLGRRPGGFGLAGGPRRPQPLSAVGSGVLVRYRGIWVVTSEHVVDGENTLEVLTSDGRSHRVRLRARDRHSDLALLAFLSEPKGLQAVSLTGPAQPVIREGSWVLATGNPFFLALDGTTVATLGVVSGTRPGSPVAYIDEPTLQHDAEINPGSSGGPLWNLEGELVGINGTIATRSRAQGGGGPAYSGASFSVPVRAVRRFLSAILGPRADASAGVSASHSVPVALPRSAVSIAGASLGVDYRSQSDARGRAGGAVVTSVLRSGAAAGALRPGDVITRVTIPGQTYVVQTAVDVDRALAAGVPGANVSVRFRRAGRVHSWAGRLGVR